MTNAKKSDIYNSKDNEYPLKSRNDDEDIPLNQNDDDEVPAFPPLNQDPMLTTSFDSAQRSNVHMRLTQV
jgi:hypothetical protein